MALLSHQEHANASVRSRPAQACFRRWLQRDPNKSISDEKRMNLRLLFRVYRRESGSQPDSVLRSRERRAERFGLFGLVLGLVGTRRLYARRAKWAASTHVWQEVVETCPECNGTGEREEQLGSASYYGDWAGEIVLVPCEETRKVRRCICGQVYPRSGSPCDCHQLVGHRFRFPLPHELEPCRLTRQR
jgi:hypothetical protein